MLELLIFEDREVISSHDFHDMILKNNSSCAFARRLHSTILNYCSEIWKLVKPILCADSPDGFELDDSDDHDSEVGSRDILSLAWRTLKESR